MFLVFSDIFTNWSSHSHWCKHCRQEQKKEFFILEIDCKHMGWQHNKCFSELSYYSCRKCLKQLHCMLRVILSICSYMNLASKTYTQLNLINCFTNTVYFIHNIMNWEKLCYSELKFVKMTPKAILIFVCISHLGIIKWENYK